MSLFASQAMALPQTPISPNYDLTTSQTSSWNKVATRLHELYEDNVGLLLIAASQLFMTFMSVTVKFLNQLDDPVPTLELILVRMLITYFCSVTYLLVKNVPHPILGPPEVRYLLIIRGFSGFFGLFGLYYSLKYLSLSDAVVLTFLAPTTTAISGFLFLHESISRREVLAGLLSLLGVVLIARPQSLFGKHPEDITLPAEDGPDVAVANAITPAQRLVAVGVALIGVFGATGAYVSLRAIGKQAHALHSLTFFSSYSVIVSIIGMIIFKVKPVVPAHWSWCGILLLIGIWGFLGQLLLTMGLQRETASRGTLALYVQIVLATVLERIIFNVTPSYLSILGTFIIMGSAIYIVVNKDTNSTAYKRIPQSIDNLELHDSADDSVELSPLRQDSEQC